MAVLLKKIGITPQHCMYASTFNDDVIQLVSEFVGSFTPFTIKKEKLKLKGVRHFRIILTDAEKLEFMCRIQTETDSLMTMVFVN